MLELFDTRYWDFTAKHFDEMLVAEHGCKRSCNWVVADLAGTWAQAPGTPARRELPGMMLYQDGLRYEWVPGAGET